MTGERGGAPVVLVVEDDRETRGYLAGVVEEIGAAVETVASLAAARVAFCTHRVSLLVVDRMLPDGSGLDWVRELREGGDRVPILVLSALRDVQERVEGLESGADDYLGKPFAPVELKARLRALLRRGHRERRPIEAGRLRVDGDRREAFVDGVELPLTEREFRVLERLVTAKGLSREELLDEIWGEGTKETAASLDVILSRLRRKLASHGLKDAIETVRGYGLKWRGEA